jgi:hypothetical protein
MKITYSIQVCNESRELFSLLNFLLKVIDEEDNINVVVDSLHTTEKVQMVLEHFKSDKITVYPRPFDTFYDNAMFHRDHVTGDYFFGIDADEMPQELLIREIKQVLEQNKVDVLFVPRINIHPGSTSEFIKKSKFQVNEGGWINWPDYQGRILKKDVEWTKELHTAPVTDGKIVGTLGPNPQVALWHIKSIEKQESRWVNDTIASPSNTNLYDLLM